MKPTTQEEVMFAADQSNGLAQLSRIDLAHRRNDGIDVVLWWLPEEDSVAVEVLHLATDESFELVVDRDRALDAFYHPFAYAARARAGVLGVAA